MTRSLTPRQVVRRSPILYRATRRMRDVLAPAAFDETNPLACDGVDLCLEGYPSSGNSFALNLLRTLRPTLRISSHYHCIANLKLALKNDVPTIIIVRAPQDSIASRCRRFSTPTEMAIDEYIALNGFALDRRNAFCLVSFECLTKRTRVFIEMVAQYASLEFPCADVDEVTAIVFKRMSEWFRLRGKEVALPSGKHAQCNRRLLPKLSRQPGWPKALAVYEGLRPHLDRCVGGG